MITSPVTATAIARDVARDTGRDIVIIAHRKPLRGYELVLADKVHLVKRGIVHEIVTAEGAVRRNPRHRGM